jgi:hypothetical protein
VIHDVVRQIDCVIEDEPRNVNFPGVPLDNVDDRSVGREDVTCPIRPFRWRGHSDEIRLSPRERVEWFTFVTTEVFQRRLTRRFGTRRLWRRNSERPRRAQTGDTVGLDERRQVFQYFRQGVFVMRSHDQHGVVGSRQSVDRLLVVRNPDQNGADITTENGEFLGNSLESCRHRAADRRHDTAGVRERALFALPHERLDEHIDFSLAIRLCDGHFRSAPGDGG